MADPRETLEQAAVQAIGAARQLASLVGTQLRAAIGQEEQQTPPSEPAKEDAPAPTAPPKKAAAKKPSPARKSKTPAKGSQSEIREWALANGYDVKPQGRIAQKIVEAYNAAH